MTRVSHFLDAVGVGLRYSYCSAVPTVEATEAVASAKIIDVAQLKKTCYSLQNFTLQISNSFRRQLRNNCYHQKRSV